MVLSSDQGTVVSRGWREDLEHLVQPAHRARSTTSPPTIASPTGSTARSRIPAASASAPGRAWARSRFRNWEPTCLAGESNTVAARSEGRQHPLRRRRRRCDQALNIAVSLGGQLPAARSGRSEPQDVDSAAGLLAGRRSALLREPVRLPHARSRQDLGEDQPRSGARESGASQGTRSRHGEGYRPADDRPLRRRVHHCAVAAQRDHRLGRHRRRPDLRTPATTASTGTT